MVPGSQPAGGGISGIASHRRCASAFLHYSAFGAVGGDGKLWERADQSGISAGGREHPGLFGDLPAPASGSESAAGPGCLSDSPAGAVQGTVSAAHGCPGGHGGAGMETSLFKAGLSECLDGDPCGFYGGKDGSAHSGGQLCMEESGLYHGAVAGGA